MMKVRTIVAYVIMIGAALVALTPMVPTISMSLRSYEDIFTERPILFPGRVDFGGFLRLFGLAPVPVLAGGYTPTSKDTFLGYAFNSLVIAISSSVVVLLVSIPAAYALARFNFRARDGLATTVLTLYLMPSFALLVPFYVVFSRFNLVNTYQGLILVHVSFSLPLAIWFLRGYFVTVPWDLEESAMIDGCTRIGALVRVIVPVAGPAIAGVFLFAFLFSWDEYLYALVLTGDATRTIPVGLVQFVGEYYTDWPAIMAGTITFSAPVAILFLLFQRYFLTGLTAGAVKQ